MLHRSTLHSPMHSRYFRTCTCTVLWRCWLGGRKGIQPVKNWVVGYWRGYLTVARCRLAYGPGGCHCYSLSLASVKSRLVFHLLYWLTRVVPNIGPLNRCVCVCTVAFTDDNAGDLYSTLKSSHRIHWCCFGRTGTLWVTPMWTPATSILSLVWTCLLQGQMVVNFSTADSFISC